MPKILTTLLFFALAFGVRHASAQTTEFTYQGQLQNASAPANGSFDFEFLLFDTANVGTGTQVGTTLAKPSISVANGAFSVRLDFGSQFPGVNRFLEIHVKQTGGGGFTPLTPRQPVNSAPYAVKSLSADTATNATNAATANNATQLGGVVASQFVLTGDTRLTDARSPLPGSTNYIQNQSAAPQAASNFNISGNGTTGGNLTVNGNVGIGTASPANKLDVRGNILVQSDNIEMEMRGSTADKSSEFMFKDSTGATHGVIGYAGQRARGDLDNTIHISSFGGHDIVFKQNGGDVMRLTSNGRVGIRGLTTFNNVGTPVGAPLEVRETGSPATNWQSSQFRISNPFEPNKQLNIGYDATNNVGVLQPGQSGSSFTNLLLNPFGGNVGVGIALPSEKLHVAGNGLFTGGLELGGSVLIYPKIGNGGLDIRNRTNKNFSQVIFTDDLAVYRGYLGYIGANAGLGARDDTVEFGTNGKHLTFRPNETELMRLSADGKVIVGTAAQDALNITGSSLSGTWLNFGNTSQGGRKWNLISTGKDNGETAGKLLIRDDIAGVRATFDSNGNLGIGTTSPNAKLDVNGNINANNLPGIKYSQCERGVAGQTSCLTAPFHIGAGQSATIDQITVNVPSSGYLFITASIAMYVEDLPPNLYGSAQFNLFKCDSAECAGGTYVVGQHSWVVFGGRAMIPITITWVLAVTNAGPVTLRTNAGADRPLSIDANSLTAIYLPKLY